MRIEMAKTNIAQNALTQQRLKELLDYDLETGVFTWKVGRKGTAKGDVAGCLHKDTGYLRIGIDYVDYMSHRLAWLYVYGAFPDETIDHIDRVRSNNSIANLRAATYSQNQANTSAYVTNKCGIKGIRFRKDIRRWQARICMNRKQTNLGTFDTAEEARAAYKAAAEIYYGEFANV
jgi:hypothetical protein